MGTTLSPGIPPNAVIANHGVGMGQFLWNGVMEMVDTQQFEMTLDALATQIEEVKDPAVKSNLEDINGVLYGIYEDVLCLDVEGLEQENEMIKRLLAEHLSEDDKRYYRMKYHIDI